MEKDSSEVNKISLRHCYTTEETLAALSDNNVLADADLWMEKMQQLQEENSLVHRQLQRSTSAALDALSDTANALEKLLENLKDTSILDEIVHKALERFSCKLVKGRILPTLLRRFSCVYAGAISLVKCSRTGRLSTTLQKICDLFLDLVEEDGVSTTNTVSLESIRLAWASWQVINDCPKLAQKFYKTCSSGLLKGTSRVNAIIGSLLVCIAKYRLPAWVMLPDFASEKGKCCVFAASIHRQAEGGPVWVQRMTPLSESERQHLRGLLWEWVHALVSSPDIDSIYIGNVFLSQSGECFAALVYTLVSTVIFGTSAVKSRALSCIICLCRLIVLEQEHQLLSLAKAFRRLAYGLLNAAFEERLLVVKTLLDSLQENALRMPDVIWDAKVFCSFEIAGTIRRRAPRRTLSYGLSETEFAAVKSAILARRKGRNATDYEEQLLCTLEGIVLVAAQQPKPPPRPPLLKREQMQRPRRPLIYVSKMHDNELQDLGRPATAPPPRPSMRTPGSTFRRTLVARPRTEGDCH